MRPNPYDNPHEQYGHLTGAEGFLLRWLEDKGYDYDLFSDEDLHDDDQLLYAYKAFIIHTHPEYWTKEMYNHLYRYLQRGGNFMYLGGNGVYWKVVIDKHQNVLEVRKEGETHKYEATQGGQWRNLDLPEQALLGVAYDARGYGTEKPYVVKSEGHPFFKGMNLKNGDLFGTQCVNRDGASGLETDKIGTHSPRLTLLARGNNPDDGGADMVTYEHPGGGTVFSVGSVSYTSALPVDSNISRLTQNVLNHMLK
ncbi:hypothetical protein KFE98_10740 [bacterium SCSIO 12741]|nr:hypothetical protein KFE98_10740 [bacterium SCSIO 12741]